MYTIILTFFELPIDGRTHMWLNAQSLEFHSARTETFPVLTKNSVPDSVTKLVLSERQTVRISVHTAKHPNSSS